MKHFSFLIAFIFFSTSFLAQEKKSIHIKRANIASKIDGILDDLVWLDAELAEGFIQFRPDIGVQENPNKKTIVKVTYDDDAIYFGAYHDDNPDEITKQLQSRDN